MIVHHTLDDDQWNQIKDLLPGQPGQLGRVARDNRQFVNAVLWIAKTGAPWRDLPTEYGRWNSVWRRFDRWVKKGIWKAVVDTLSDPDLERLIINSTTVRGDSQAAGAQKNSRLGRFLRR